MFIVLFSLTMYLYEKEEEEGEMVQKGRKDEKEERKTTPVAG